MSLPSMMKEQTVNDLIGNFRITIEESAKSLALITESQSRVPRTEGKWTPKETIGHLIDSAANNHQRFIRGQFKDDMIFPGYEQEKWVNVQRYNEEPWPTLIQLWKLYNVHLAHVISSIPESLLKKTVSVHNLDEIGWQQISRNEPATIEYLIIDYVAHMKHHLRQVLGS